MESNQAKRKPYKLNNNKKEIYLESIRNGSSKSAAARSIDVSRTTIWQHAKTDKAFADALAEAEIMACDAVEDKLWHMALNGDRMACIYWLQNRSPDRWKDRRATAKIEVKQPPDNWREEIDKIFMEINRGE